MPEIKKPLFIESEQCRSLKNCRACRFDQTFRDKIKQEFEVPNHFDSFCPVLVPKKLVFTETAHCLARIHCKACRQNDQFRQSIRDTFEVPENFDSICPITGTIDPPVIIASPSPSPAKNCCGDKSVKPVPATASPQNFPSLHQEVLNLASAVARAAVSLVTTGKVIAPEEVRKTRIAICEQCDQLKVNRCLKCGCYTAAKVALATEKCPYEPPKWVEAPVTKP